MKDNFIRTVYLYLFTLVGLAVLVIGVGRLVDIGLKMYIFTYADMQNDYRYERPMPLVFDQNISKVEEIQSCGETCELTESQMASIDSWLVDYQEWKDSDGEEEKVDYRRQSRERQASGAIAQIIVGLPLYWYHWAVIKRDRKRKA
jgi:hypothetical protein